MSSLCAGPSSQRWSGDIPVYIKIKQEDSDCTHPFVCFDVTVMTWKNSRVPNFISINQIH